MGLRTCFFLSLGVLLLVQPASSQLPPPGPIMQPTQPPGPTTPPPPPEPTSHLAFNFNGFFKYFIDAFKPEGLKELLRMTALKVKTLFPNEQIQSSPAGPAPIPCSTAPAIPNAQPRYSDPMQRSHTSTATYTCNPGYQGTDVVIMCQSGAWTTPAANMSCTIVMCGKPPNVDNADVLVGDFTFNSQASYRCKPGFHASDIAHPVRCRETGQWDKPRFTCANMYASNQAISQAMSRFGLGGRRMPGMPAGLGGNSAGGMQGMQGLPPSVQGLMSNVAGALMQKQLASAMGGGQPQGAGMNGMSNGMGAMLPPHLSGAMANSFNQEQPAAALPPHLAGLAPLGIMNGLGMNLPGMGMGMTMPGMPGAGSVPGMPGAAPTGPGGKKMEPEQMQEMQMMMMMSSMMRARQQQQQRAVQMRQEKLRQERLLRERQEQQKQQQQQESPSAGETPALNIGSLMNNEQGSPSAAPSSTQPNQMQMLQSALQQMQQLASQMQAGMGQQAPPPANTPTGGSPSGTPQSGSSVFGGGAQQQPPATSGSENPLMSAIMQSAMASQG